MPANAASPASIYGRKNRNPLEGQISALTPKLQYDPEEERKSGLARIQGRADQLSAGIARKAGLEGSGLSTGLSGQNIRLMGTIGQQQLAEEENLNRQISQQGGAENRANLQSLLGAQGQEDQRQQNVAQLTGQLQIGQGMAGADLLPLLGFNPAEGLTNGAIGAARNAGFEWDQAEQKFIKQVETLASKGQKASIELQKGQQTGNLDTTVVAGATGGVAGGEQRTLGGQQLDIQATQAQAQIELAERQRTDARDIEYQKIGFQSAELAEQARQFDGEIFQRSSEFAANFGLSNEQFLETKAQFDAGIAIQDRELAEQMRQFDAQNRLHSAELFGGTGLSRNEMMYYMGSQSGQPGYRSDFDFNKDGKIDSEDNAIFDQFANEDGVIPGVGTLEQRQQEAVEARTGAEMERFSRQLGIEESKVRQAFEESKDQRDELTRQFNSTFTGRLFRTDPTTGDLFITTKDGDPVSNVDYEIAKNSLDKLENSLAESVPQFLARVGVSTDKFDDPQQYMAAASLYLSNLVPSGVSYGGGGPQRAPQGNSFLSTLAGFSGNAIGTYLASAPTGT